jgi:Zn-dependent protease
MLDSLQTSDKIVVLSSFMISFLVGFILHEIAHGKEALKNGDPSALLAGRLSYNLFKHLSLYGSFIVPILLYVIHSPFLLLTGKPVPVSFPAIKTYSGYKGLFKVSLAGIKINLILAIIAGVIIYIFGIKYNVHSFLSNILHFSVFLNLLLAFFNLLPIPPLDGGKVLLFLIQKYNGPILLQNILIHLDGLAGFLVLIGFMLSGLGSFVFTVPLFIMNFISPSFIEFFAKL